MLQHVLLTVSAIIQAVAFTELMTTGDLFAFPTNLTFAACLKLLQGLAMLQIIVLTWHEILIFMIGYELMPRELFGLRESYLPFVLGTIEVQLVHTLVVPQTWVGWLAVYVGAIFFVNLSMYRKLGNAQRASPERFGQRYRRFKHLNLVYPPLLCGLFAAAAWWWPPLTTSNLAELFLVLNVVCLGIAYSAHLLWDDVRLHREPLQPLVLPSASNATQ